MTVACQLRLDLVGRAGQPAAAGHCSSGILGSAVLK